MLHNTLSSAVNAKFIHVFALLILLREVSAAVTTKIPEKACENPLFNSNITKSQANAVIGEMLIKFGVEPDFAPNAFQCMYYFSHIDLYMQARHEIHPADFPDVREANEEFFECLSQLSHGSNEVFNEVAPSSQQKPQRRGRMSPPLNPTLVALCGMKEGQWEFPRNIF
ncbi:uncharacterized protein LOC114828309 [Galendromus occidentalis]|uniref:Uncharacterized protein LOC114828309 n=1 Tax=Galendromus occidentalis TaxID=34638 RepID=A0AAJ7WI33_9ACAR|nr:uncharacterized protein LOC114828309 [Galendromus occidentalis]